MDVGNARRADHHPNDRSLVLNRIMFKFRPIAPKPAAAGSGSAPEETKSDVVPGRRSKRKYVRVKKKVTRCSNKNNNKVEGEEEERKNPSGVLTLQLLPESSGGATSESTEKMLDFSTTAGFQAERPFWMVDNHRENEVVWPDRRDLRMTWRVVESWVMVDGMTNAGGRETLGNTDIEKMRNLEVDTCPGIISDGLDRVQWVNLAYQRMVDPMDGGGVPPAEVVVRLVVKDDKIRTAGFANFACTVRVMYRRQTAKHTHQTMPCDVWKMDFGGFAWRFDSKAALCLGR